MTCFVFFATISAKENTYEIISDYCKTLEQPTQKDFALKAIELDKENSYYYFQKQKGVTFDDWIRQLNIDTLVEKIKKYSEKKLAEN